MATPEVIDPLKEKEQTTFAPPSVKEPEPIEQPDPVEEQTEDAFSVRDLAEKRLGKIGTGALDFVPIVGDVLAAGDVADSYREGDTLGTAVNAVALGAGIVPVVGDFVAKGLKAGLKSFRRAKAETEAPKFVDEVGETKTIKKAEPTEVSPTSKTVKAYKLFKTDKQGNLYPLFVKMENNKPIETDKWIKAEAGDIDPKTGKVKSSIGNLAYRPGFHAGDLPIATHIGGKVDLNTGQRLKGSMPPNIREENQVWAEVEMLDDVDWQTVANSRARIKKDGKPELKSAHITDQVPFGGHYRYKTNANMTGNWLIGGELKVNKILSSAEVKAINDKAGVADLPKLSDLKLDFSKGPLTPKAPLPTAIPKTDTFSGKLTLIHGFAGKPPNIVGSGSYLGPRYDSSGGTFGADGFYLEEPSRLFFNDPAQNFLQKENTLSADVTFKKAFVLRPETIGKLKKETGIKDFNDFDELEGFREGYDERRGLVYGGNMGEFIADKLKKKGYDGIIVRDFEQPAPMEDIYLRARKKGDPPNLRALFDDPSPDNLKGLKPKYSEKRKQDLYKRMEAEEVKDFNSKAPGMTVELIQPQIFYFYPEKMKNVKVLNPKYTEFKAPLEEKINPKYYEDIKRIKNPEFNKGGMAMEQQMEMAFMQEGGVLADDGVERDPVSGNEVPSGSMAEEVRDDVPAMLSEGEYVVPADVVRYHGIDKFEDLRDEAKMGLARMEADGRIGGQPVEEQEDFPFPVEELEGFQEGGAVGDIYEDVMGQPYIPPQDQESSYVARGRFPGTGFELRNFTNPRTGRTVVIPFFNGKPMQYIPPDFLEGGSSSQQTGTFDPAADDRDRQADEAQRARTPTDSAFPLPSGFPQDTQAGPRSFSEYTPEDWSRYISQTDSTLADITAKVPVLGFIQRMNENAARNYAESALRSGKNPATGQELSLTEKNALGRVLATSRNTGIIEAVKNYITGARGSTTGVPLFEQAGFEKDLLPFEPKPQDTAPQTVDPDLEEFNKRYGSVEESDLDAFQQIATDTNQYLDQTQQVAFAPERSFAELEQTFQPDREGREFVWTVLPGRFGNAQRKVRVEDAYLLGTNSLANIDTGNVIGMMPRVTSTGDDDAPILSASVLKRNIRGAIPKARDVQEEIKANIEANRFQPRQAGILESLFGFAGPAYGAPEFTDSGVLANDAYKDMSNFEKKYVNLATSMGYVGSLDGMIAKMRHETNNGENENLYNYTSKNILDTFGAIRTSAEAVKLVADANQEYDLTGKMQDYKFVVAEGVYGMNTPVGSKKLGNKQPFDGAIFTGRSQSQTTGRYNYSEVSKILYNNFPEQFTRPDFLTTLTQSEFDFYSQNIPTTISQQERYARALDNKLDDIVADPDKALKFNVGYAIHHQNMNPDTVGDPRKVIERFGGTKASKDKALEELEKLQSKGGLQTKVTLDPSKLKEEVAKGAIKVTKPPLKKPEEIDYIAPMPSVNFAEYEQDRQISAPEPLVGAELFRERERQRAEMRGGLRSQPIAQPTEESTPEFIDPIRKVAADKEERDALIKGGQRLASLDDQMQGIQRDISPVQDVDPPSTGERKVTDARAFLQGRDAAKKAVEDAISFAPKAEPKEQPKAQPKEQPKAEPTQLEKTRAKQAMGTGRSREEARDEADKVLQQTGDAFAADRAYHEAFTGFTSSGELSPSFGFGFKEGGLASRPKKTKSKKRNTKKGLGGKMAT